MAYGFVSRQNVRSTVRGSDLQPATSSYLGGVKVDEATIVIDSGVISAKTATTTSVGVVRPDNTSITLNAGILTAAPDVVRSMTAKQSFLGTTTSLAAKLVNAAEKIVVSSSTVNASAEFYVTEQSILYHTANQDSNWTLNIEGNNAVALNAVLDVGEAITITHMVTQGSTAYYCTGITVDNDPAAAVNWQNGTAPSAGTANGVDVYTYTIIKTAEDTYTVFASLSNWG